MRLRPLDLPEFERPPVVEVAIATAFDPIAGFTQALAGLYWSTIRQDYPRTQDVPRTETLIESAGAHLPPTPPFRVQFGLQLPKAWFVSADDAMLIQLQDDLFSQNWRRNTGTYPRFEVVAENFKDNFGEFREFLSKNDVPRPAIRQVEVTYINWVPDIDADRLLSCPSPTFRSSTEPVTVEPLTVMLSARHGIAEGTRRVGVLTLDAIPGRLAPAGEEGYQLALAG